MPPTKKKIFTYLGATVIILVVAAVIAALSVNPYRDYQREQENAAGQIVAACALSKMSMEAKQKIAVERGEALVRSVAGGGMRGVYIDTQGLSALAASTLNSPSSVPLPSPNAVEDVVQPIFTQLLGSCVERSSPHWQAGYAALGGLLDQDTEYRKIADPFQHSFEVAIENEKKKQDAREEEQTRINSWMFKDSQASK